MSLLARRDVAGPALIVGVLLSILASLTLAESASWDRGRLLVLVGLLAGLYLARPLLLVALLFTPFLFMDERSPDAIAQLAPLTSRAFAPLGVAFIGLAALIAHQRFPPHPARGSRQGVGATGVFAAVAFLMLIALVLSGAPSGSIARAYVPFVYTVLSAYVAWRLLRHFAPADVGPLIVRASLWVGAVLSILGVSRLIGAINAVSIGSVPLSFYDSAGPYALMTCSATAALGALQSGVVRERLLLAASASTFLMVALASQRRGVLLGFIVGGLFLLAFALLTRRLPLTRLVTSLSAVAVVAVVGLASLGQLAPGAGGVLDQRISSALAVIEGGSNEGSVNYRIQESTTVTNLIRENLITGIGPDAEYRSTDASYVRTGGYIHNSYLMFPLRYGVLGVLAVLTLAIGIVVAVTAGLRRRETHLLAWALGAALIAFLPAISTAAFLTSTARWPVMLGLIAGAFDVLCQKPHPQDRPGSSTPSNAPHAETATSSAHAILAAGTPSPIASYAPTPTHSQEGPGSPFAEGVADPRERAAPAAGGSPRIGRKLLAVLLWALLLPGSRKRKRGGRR